MMEQAVAVKKKHMHLFKIPSRRSSPVRQWTNVLGSNQDAAYPSGLCAERVAIFQAGAIYPEAKFLKWLLPQLPTQ
jgi:cytidine deaminase